MQDRFKFRIFERESKEMFELDAVGYSSFDPFGKGVSRLIMIPSGIENSFHYNKQCLYDKDKYSEPMQCSGLKDKNGKLIYERDIVKEYSDIGEFVMIKEVCFFEDVMFGFNVNSAYEYEIIGNIYENPGVLKKHENKL